MWIRELKFCPLCAGPLRRQRRFHERIVHPTCARCSFVLWQNPKPTVGALILRGRGERREILLSRRAVDPHRGLWDVPGGFMDLDETPEQTVVRECREEMGIEVRVGAFVGAFLDEYQGDERTLNLHYRCEVVAGEPRPSSDIDLVRWFPLRRVPRIAFQNGIEAVRALRCQLESRRRGV